MQYLCSKYLCTKYFVVIVFIFFRIGLNVFLFSHCKYGCKVCINPYAWYIWAGFSLRSFIFYFFFFFFFFFFVKFSDIFTILSWSINKIQNRYKIERKAMVRNRYNYPTPPIKDIKRKETQPQNNWTLMETSLAESQTDSYFPTKRQMDI